MRHVLCRPQWLLKPEIPQQFKQPVRLQDPIRLIYRQQATSADGSHPDCVSKADAFFIRGVKLMPQESVFVSDILSACSQFTGWKVR